MIYKGFLIEDWQNAGLVKLAHELEVSRSKLVRRALDNFLTRACEIYGVDYITGPPPKISDQILTE
jgi:hypothetical protein